MFSWGGRNGGNMRILVAMVLSTALLAGTAYAQGMGGRAGKGHRSPDAQQQKAADQQKKKAVDDAYRSALGRIPDAKYDPWKTAR
jgi:hypothetical protein